MMLSIIKFIAFFICSFICFVYAEDPTPVHAVLQNTHACRYLSPSECWAENFNYSVGFGDDIVLHEDFFEELSRKNKPEKSRWRVEEGVLQQYKRNGAILQINCNRLRTNGNMVIGKSSYFLESGDYKVSVRIRHLAGDKSNPNLGSIGMVFRFIDEKNHYRFEWNDDRACMVLSKYVDDTVTVLDYLTNYGYCQNQTCNQNATSWFNIVIVANGTQLSAYVDEVLKLSANDTEFSSGAVGTYTSRAQKVQFDDITTVLLSREERLGSWEERADPCLCCTTHATQCYKQDFSSAALGDIVPSGGGAGDGGIRAWTLHVNGDEFTPVEDGPRALWETASNWSVVQVAEEMYLSQTTSAEVVSSSVCEDSFGTYLLLNAANELQSPDLLISLKMRSKGTGAIGVMAQFQHRVHGFRDLPNYVRVDFANDSSVSYCHNLNVFEQGLMSSLVRVDDFEPVDDAWVHIDIWVRGKHVLVQVDGLVHMDHHGGGLGHGGVALYCRGDAQCEFDDIVVVERNALDEAVFAPGSTPAEGGVSDEKARARALLPGVWEGVITRMDVFNHTCSAETHTQNGALIFDEHDHLTILLVGYEEVPSQSAVFRVDALDFARLQYSAFDSELMQYGSATVNKPQICDALDITDTGSMVSAEWIVQETSVCAGASASQCCPDPGTTLFCSGSEFVRVGVLQQISVGVGAYSGMFAPTLKFIQPVAGTVLTHGFSTVVQIEWEALYFNGWESAKLELVRDADNDTMLLFEGALADSGLLSGGKLHRTHSLGSMPSHWYVGACRFRVTVEEAGVVAELGITLRCAACAETSVALPRGSDCAAFCTDPNGCVSDSCPGYIDCPTRVHGSNGTTCMRYEQRIRARCAMGPPECSGRNAYELCDAHTALVPNHNAHCTDVLCVKSYACLSLSLALESATQAQACYVSEPGAACTTTKGPDYVCSQDAACVLSSGTAPPSPVAPTPPLFPAAPTVAPTPPLSSNVPCNERLTCVGCSADAPESSNHCVWCNGAGGGGYCAEIGTTEASSCFEVLGGAQSGVMVIDFSLNGVCPTEPQCLDDHGAGLEADVCTSCRMDPSCGFCAHHLTGVGSCASVAYAGGCRTQSDHVWYNTTVQCPHEPPTPLPTPPPPSASPTSSPTTPPTERPTAPPTAQPTEAPSKQPTTTPTLLPTRIPTKQPTFQPTKLGDTPHPTGSPTTRPTNTPTAPPTKRPTLSPTAMPTNEPTVSPTTSPTKQPSATTSTAETSTSTSTSTTTQQTSTTTSTIGQAPQFCSPVGDSDNDGVDDCHDDRARIARNASTRFMYYSVGDETPHLVAILHCVARTLNNLITGEPIDVIVERGLSVDAFDAQNEAKRAEEYALEELVPLTPMLRLSIDSTARDVVVPFNRPFYVCMEVESDRSDVCFGSFNTANNKWKCDSTTIMDPIQHNFHCGITVRFNELLFAFVVPAKPTTTPMRSARGTGVVSTTNTNTGVETDTPYISTQQPQSSTPDESVSDDEPTLIAGLQTEVFVAILAAALCCCLYLCCCVLLVRRYRNLRKKHKGRHRPLSDNENMSVATPGTMKGSRTGAARTHKSMYNRTLRGGLQTRETELLDLLMRAAKDEDAPESEESGLKVAQMTGVELVDTDDDSFSDEVAADGRAMVSAMEAMTLKGAQIDNISSSEDSDALVVALEQDTHGMIRLTEDDEPPPPPPDDNATPSMYYDDDDDEW